MPDNVKLRVRHGWAVHHDGAQRVGGDIVTVNPAVAQEWTRRGWAEPAADDVPVTRGRRKAGDTQAPGAT